MRAYARCSSDGEVRRSALVRVTAQPWRRDGQTSTLRDAARTARERDYTSALTSPRHVIKQTHTATPLPQRSALKTHAASACNTLTPSASTPRMRAC